MIAKGSDSGGHFGVGRSGQREKSEEAERYFNEFRGGSAGGTAMKKDGRSRRFHEKCNINREGQANNPWSLT